MLIIITAMTSRLAVVAAGLGGALPGLLPGGWVPGGGVGLSKERVHPRGRGPVFHGAGEGLLERLKWRCPMAGAGR